MTPSNDPSTSGRAILWMVPRTVSTAFAKCMSGVPECEIWGEPFLYCHMAHREMEKFGMKEVPMSYDGNEAEYQSVISSVCAKTMCQNIIPERLAYATIKKGLESSTSKYVFSKDESVAMWSERQRKYIPTGYRHAFLIRHPILVFASLRKGLFRGLQAAKQLRYEEDESSFDLRKYNDGNGFDAAFERHHNLWKYILDKVDPSTIVISSDDLLTSPEKILPKYCVTMGFPYSESLLSWDASPDVFSKWIVPNPGEPVNTAFAAVALSSTHFTPPKAVPAWEQLTEDVKAYAEKAMPYYQEMYENRLTV
ncbi:uncharacterized protein [Diadema setosum]|uniref:uncharacterized protein n=1 Tax=Diadema setosum TaxID=31175 RepID=UPI003B39FB37